MFREIFQLMYQQVSLLVSATFSLSSEQAWSRFDKSLAYAAKSCHDDSWQGRTFWHQYALLAEWERIFLFLKCCTVQFKDSVSFWGPKAFSFGRCDQGLKTSVVKWSKLKVLGTDWNLSYWKFLIFLILVPQTVRKMVAV